MTIQLQLHYSSMISHYFNMKAGTANTILSITLITIFVIINLQLWSGNSQSPSHTCSCSRC